jgi:hypothetical protein
VIENATHADFLQIPRDLPHFWATSGPPERTMPYHYPFLVHEFGDTAFVVRSADEVVAYLFGFIATAEPVGYVHLVGVRAAHQGGGSGVPSTNISKVLRSIEAVVAYAR